MSLKFDVVNSGACTIGLAFSIESTPFSIIVAIVVSMMLIEFFQSAKEGLKNGGNKKSLSLYQITRLN